MVVSSQWDMIKVSTGQTVVFDLIASSQKSNERNGTKWGREIEKRNLDENESQNISERTKSGKRKVEFSEKSLLISGF